MLWSTLPHLQPGARNSAEIAGIWKNRGSFGVFSRKPVKSEIAPETAKKKSLIYNALKNVQSAIENPLPVNWIVDSDI